MASKRLTVDDETYLESYVAQQKILWDQIKRQNNRLTASANESEYGSPARNNHNRESVFPHNSPIDAMRAKWRNTEQDNMHNITSGIEQQESEDTEKYQDETICPSLKSDESSERRIDTKISLKNESQLLNDYSNHDERQISGEISPSLQYSLEPSITYADVENGGARDRKSVV